LQPDARAARLTMPERLRRTLEELGPTYVKLGQLFSTRPDIIPPEYLGELSTLLDAVPPFPAEIAVEQVELELGQPIKAIFASFDWGISIRRIVFIVAGILGGWLLLSIARSRGW
jgi:ubiquinone biosynthesis protein